MNASTDDAAVDSVAFEDDKGSRRLVALDVDFGPAPVHGAAVVPGLHAQERFHGDAGGLLDPQRHLRGAGRPRRGPDRTRPPGVRRGFQRRRATGRSSSFRTSSRTPWAAGASRRLFGDGFPQGWAMAGHRPRSHAGTAPTSSLGDPGSPGQITARPRPRPPPARIPTVPWTTRTKN